MLRSRRPRKSRPEARGDAPATAEEQALAARDAAVRHLARREHTRRELEEKLTARGHPRAVVISVLDGLADEGLLSDARFLEHFVAVRAGRGYGPVRIRAELAERGIVGAPAAAALEAAGVDWAASAAEQRERRFGSEMPPDWTTRAKQMRFLEARGFSNEQIRTALRGPVDE